MSRSSNQKRKRKTRRATGVPCEAPTDALVVPPLDEVISGYRAAGWVDAESESAVRAMFLTHPFSPYREVH